MISLADTAKRRRSWRWLLVLLAFIACRDSGRVRQVEATATFEPSALDFGEVPVGEWRTLDVQIINNGHVPFRAFEALPGLISPSFLIEMAPGEVRPGESRWVRVRFHPLEEGPHSQTVTVRTDADRESTRSLSIRGTGLPTPIALQPQHLDFQTLEIDSERTLELSIENPVDLPVVLSIEGPDHDLFSTDQVTIAPHSSQTLRAVYRPTRLGASSAQLRAKTCASCTPVVVNLVGVSVPSAFVFDPAPVPFQEVPVHERTRSRTQATNITWREVEVQQLVASDGFEVVSTLSANRIPPGGAVELELEYAARTSGPALGTLHLDYLSDRARQSQVLLDARGGRAQLALAPTAIDFGELPVGGKGGRVVRLTNAGTQGDLHVLGLTGRGETGQFGASPPFRDRLQVSYLAGSAWPNLLLDAHPIAPGTDYLDVELYFQPEQPGTFRGEVVIRTDDLFNPERVVTVTGRARVSGPCSFRVLPNPLAFGNVPVGKGAVLGFRFENTSLAECAVKDIHLSNDAQGAFFMPGGPLTGGVVIRDDSFAAQIAFRASSEGSYSGELSITVNNPATPVVRVPLTASAVESCLTAAPGYLDFGPIRYDCVPTPRRTWVSNRCPTPIEVSEVLIGPGTSTQFSLLQPPPTPLRLAPGEGFELVGTYARTVHGQHFSPLWIESPQEPTPYLIPLLAETNHEGVQVERFIQGTSDELDVLLVISNTSTMGPYQRRLENDIPGWIRDAQSRGVDLRVGVTTTGLVERSPACPGGAQGGEAGRLFPVDRTRPHVVHGARPDAASSLQQNLRVGSCHNLMQGLETMRAALSSPLIDSSDDVRTPQPNDGNLGFLRDRAQLAVLFLADEDDHSGFEVEAYLQFLQTLKGPNMGHRVTAFAIVPVDAQCVTAGAPGPRFSSLAVRTGGEVRSICEPRYTPLLEQITLRASGPQAEFVLQTPPSSASDLVVRVDGRVVSPSAWWFEPTRNAIVFHSTQVPAPGQTVEVRYRSACPAAP